MTKKIKGIICAVGFLVCGFILGTCGTTVNAKQDEPLRIWFENENGKMQTYRIVDKKTGVNYIVVAGNGYEEVGTAITPRLNIDGSLYTSK